MTSRSRISARPIRRCWNAASSNWRRSQKGECCVYSPATPNCARPRNPSRPRLALGNITVLDQSSGSSRQLLLDSFVSEERAVLMGTRSFWEGVDIPGQDLSALVIARLPFSVPSEPIFAARSEQYGDRSFMQYSIPRRDSALPSGASDGSSGARMIAGWSPSSTSA